MNPKLNRKSNGAFTLVEIIGVLAIIGILAAVVTPRVIDGIREGRVTQLVQNLGQWKSGADRYLQKQQVFPRDGLAAVTTQEGNPYQDPRTGNAVTAAQTSFGDVLLAQGLASGISVPFGAQGANRVDLTAGNAIGNVNTVALSQFAQIRCSEEQATTDNNFTATQTRDVPHRVVYLAIPDVPLQEAAAIKAKIDGPFNSVANQGSVNDTALLTAAVTGTTTAAAAVVPPAQVEALARGNCRVGSGTTASVYDLYIYITND